MTEPATIPEHGISASELHRACMLVIAERLRATIVRTADLAKSGLIGPGSLYETQYRLRLPPEADLAALKRDANRQFRDNGLRWRDRRRFRAEGAESVAPVGEPWRGARCRRSASATTPTRTLP